MRPEREVLVRGCSRCNCPLVDPGSMTLGNRKALLLNTVRWQEEGTRAGLGSEKQRPTNFFEFSTTRLSAQTEAISAGSWQRTSACCDRIETSMTPHTWDRPQSKSISDSACQPRSEEHTSELQSPCNLVCRLLLEKKK